MFEPKALKLGKERSAIRELYEYGNARKAQIGAEKVFDFSIGNPSIPAPEAVREALRKALNEIPAEVLHGYTSAAGLYEARKTVAEFLQNRFSAPASAELTYLTCGASAGLAIAFHALLNAGDEVIVVAPFFPEYRVFIEGAGGKLVSVPAGRDFGLDCESIGRAITKKTRAILLNSPNNPTGTVYGEEELRALAALLNEKNRTREEPVYLFTDEPYRELAYEKEAVSPFSFYPHCVMLYSFSKSVSLAGERIGYLSVRADAYRAEDFFFAVCGAGRKLGYVCAPALFQRVLPVCLTSACDLEEYRKNRDFLYNALTEFGFECVKPEGAFYLFVKSPEEDEVAFCERAKAHELLLVPSASFGVKGYVRISYCVAYGTIERSLPAFKALAEEYKLG